MGEKSKDDSEIMPELIRDDSEENDSEDESGGPPGLVECHYPYSEHFIEFAPYDNTFLVIREHLNLACDPSEKYEVKIISCEDETVYLYLKYSLEGLVEFIKNHCIACKVQCLRFSIVRDKVTFVKTNFHTHDCSDRERIESFIKYASMYLTK